MKVAYVILKKPVRCFRLLTLTINRIRRAYLILPRAHITIAITQAKIQAKEDKYISIAITSR